ncbi:class IIb bacteriocin, lactobin A/cerein 7B family [Ruminococcus sp.]|nr:class IIb bacteriocin, lactobin A/cerein 7B family [Ruminococcus sp.]
MEYTMNNGFAELNAVEMENIDGGIIPLIVYAGAFVGSLAVSYGLTYVLA